MLSGVRAVRYALGRRNVQWRQIGRMATKEDPEPLPDRTSMTLDELKAVDPVTGVDRSRWTFDYDKELSALASRLGHSLDKLPSLRTALVHQSALAKERRGMSPVNLEHNGRLAVLGKSSIEFYLSEFIYCTYPNLEGYCICDISRYVASSRCLSLLANYLGVSSLVLTRTEPFNTEPSYITSTDQINEVTSSQLDKPTSRGTVLSHSFSAVLGAVYVDRGPHPARYLIHTLFVSLLKDLDVHSMIKFSHPKFILFKLMEEQKKPLPVARIINESGRLSHFPTFHVGMYSGEQLLGDGMGSSKDRAESEAAAAALHRHFLKKLKKAPLPSDYDDFISEKSFTLMREVNPEEEINSISMSNKK